MRISLRHKIQFVVLMIVFVSLSLYIWQASKVLLNEKMINLMDSSVAMSEVLGSRLRSTLAAQQAWVDTALQKKSSIPKVADELPPHLLWFGTRRNGKVASSPPFANEPPLGIPESSHLELSYFLNENQSFWVVKRDAAGTESVSLWSAHFWQQFSGQVLDGVMLVSALDSKTSLVFNSQDPAWNKLLQSWASEMSLFRAAEASRIDIKGSAYIVAASVSPGWILMIGYPESLAMAPVRDLQQRSIYFAFMILGLTSLISIWLGAALTRKLSILTQEANRIARGNLDINLEITSKDEVGELSTAIQNMSADLKKYVGEVQEKIRMETELKTARAVQESLLPEGQFVHPQAQLCGYYASASECGGDFWYYWKQDSTLYFIVADATGHGAPAALITSAARSTISNFETLGEQDLVKMASLLDSSIRATSKGKIYMTAFLAKYNLETGHLDFLNCSHEPAFLIKAGEEMEIVRGILHPRLGDFRSAKNLPALSSAEISVGATLLIYTDGLLERSDSANETLSQIRFARASREILQTPNELGVALQALRDYSDKCVGHSQLEDDITIVALRRHGKGAH